MLQVPVCTISHLRCDYSYVQQLIAEICVGDALEIGELVARLGASPQLIEAILEHLQRSSSIRSCQLRR